MAEFSAHHSTQPSAQPKGTAGLSSHSAQAPLLCPSWPRALLWSACICRLPALGRVLWLPGTG